VTLLALPIEPNVQLKVALLDPILVTDTEETVGAFNVDTWVVEVEKLNSLPVTEPATASK